MSYLNQKAVPYMSQVKDFALAKGMKFFTYDEQLKAIIAYERSMLTKN